MIKFSYLNGTWTRDLPTCGMVSQPLHYCIPPQQEFPSLKHGLLYMVQEESDSIAYILWRVWPKAVVTMQHSCRY
jgi:hypothetical protein